MLVLFAVGSLAGTLNVVAGGGSMLTLPTLILVGLPPTVANGTNRVALLMQNTAAIESFRRHGLVQWGWIRQAALPAALGAALGAAVGVSMGDLAFQRLLAVAMLAVALWMIAGPGMATQTGEVLDSDRFPLGRAGLTLAFVATGFYGGLVQVGLGFIVLAIVAGAGMDLVRGNALKVVVAWVFHVPAIAIYAASGMVDWRLGATLGVGTVCGGLFGVRLNVLKGQAWIRRVVVLAVVVLAIRLLVG